MQNCKIYQTAFLNYAQSIDSNHNSNKSFFFGKYDNLRGSFILIVSNSHKNQKSFFLSAAAPVARQAI
jgi:hypothetical protein